MNIFILKSDTNVILVCCLAIVCEVNKFCIDIILFQLYSRTRHCYHSWFIENMYMGGLGYSPCDWLLYMYGSGLGYSPYDGLYMYGGGLGYSPHDGLVMYGGGLGYFTL